MVKTPVYLLDEGLKVADCFWYASSSLMGDIWLALKCLLRLSLQNKEINRDA